jgi:hypothetical protein
MVPQHNHVQGPERATIPKHIRLISVILACLRAIVTYSLTLDRVSFGAVAGQQVESGRSTTADQSVGQVQEYGESGSRAFVAARRRNRLTHGRQPSIGSEYRSHSSERHEWNRHMPRARVECPLDRWAGVIEGREAGTAALSPSPVDGASRSRRTRWPTPGPDRAAEGPSCG